MHTCFICFLSGSSGQLIASIDGSFIFAMNLVFFFEKLYYHDIIGEILDPISIYFCLFVITYLKLPVMYTHLKCSYLIGFPTQTWILFPRTLGEWDEGGFG